jgi:small subunit ribosomal protein S20
MPIKQNAKKSLRQAKKRTAENLVFKKAYKEAVKAVKKAVVAGEKDLTEKVRLAQKKLDKAAKKGVLKKNAAARHLSRLVKNVKKAVAK